MSPAWTWGHALPWLGIQEGKLQQSAMSRWVNVSTRDMLIWQIEEYLYPTSILGMIYHIRADAFIFFGL